MLITAPTPLNILILLVSPSFTYQQFFFKKKSFDPQFIIPLKKMRNEIIPFFFLMTPEKH